MESKLFLALLTLCACFAAVVNGAPHVNPSRSAAMCVAFDGQVVETTHIRGGAYYPSPLDSTIEETEQGPIVTVRALFREAGTVVWLPTVRQ